MPPSSWVDMSLFTPWKHLPITINSETEKNDTELPTTALPKPPSGRCWLGERLSPPRTAPSPTSDAIWAPLQPQEGRAAGFSAGSARPNPPSRTDEGSPKRYKEPARRAAEQVWLAPRGDTSAHSLGADWRLPSGRETWASLLNTEQGKKANQKNVDFRNLISDGKICWGTRKTARSLLPRGHCPARSHPQRDLHQDLHRIASRSLFRLLHLTVRRTKWDQRVTALLRSGEGGLAQRRNACVPAKDAVITGSPENNLPTEESQLCKHEMGGL